jgi:hypothetical protein
MNDRKQIGYLLAGLLALLVGLTLIPYTGLMARAGPPDPATNEPNADTGPDVSGDADGPYRLFLPIIVRGGDGGPIVGEPVTPHVFDGDLRDLPTVEPWQPGDPIRVVPRGLWPVQEPERTQIEAGPSQDPLLGLQESASQDVDSLDFSIPNLNFEGISFTGVFPPDPVGDVGPDHYIQMVNTHFQIFDKQGNPLLLDAFGNPNPRLINSLWNVCVGGTNDGTPCTVDTDCPGGTCGTGGPCQTRNDGDPIVLYDQLASRWLISQFARPSHECVAISQTGDPIAGGWYLYEFDVGEFPDYPKLGVWPDAYYMSSNESDPAAYALDRTQMINGLAANPLQRRTVPDLSGFGFEALTPSDLDGVTPPPAGAPNYFIRHRDDEAHNPGSNDPSQDFLEIWEFHVDFDDPTNTTFTGPTQIPIAEFDSDLCGFGFVGCFPQPNTATTLDPLREVVMWRLQYRNFGTHETLVGNLATDVDATDHGGIRWFELRKTGGGAWTLFQEGTYAPDAAHRWMGSIAMDNEGNIALGYSVSSNVVSPSVRYAGRLADDPIGTLPQGEATIIDGVFSQDLVPTFNATPLGIRWGDYSSMNVDPVDDCTFWYTNEYVASDTDLFASDGTALGNGVWGTRIASFWFCNHPPVADANGPYVTDEGVEISLDGTGSSDPDGDILTYEWDLDNDGIFDDAFGPTPVYDQVGQDGVFPVFLRVTDPEGALDIDQTSVTVSNVAPNVILDSDAPQDEGSPVTVSGIVTDPGWLDPLSATINWDDGSPLEVIDGDLENDRPDATFTFEVAHVYGDNGDYNAEVCASDDDTTVCETIVLQIDNVDPTADIDLSDTVLVNGVPTFLAHVEEPMQFSGRSTDPGSDDLYLSWDWDDGPPSPDVTTTYLVNPPDPDPFPSPSVQPRDVTDVQSHTFGDACLYHIDFLADDDDGGHGQDNANVLITGNADRARSAGYWQHQYRGNGNIDFDQATLECYLAIVGYVSTVFNEERDASTIELAYDVLFMQQNEGEAREHFDRELLTVWLNFANGAYEYNQMLDTDQDGVFDTPLVEVVATAEAVRLDPTASEAEIREQTNILHHIPQMSR